MQYKQNILETIPGVGPKTRAKLLRKFGSVRGVGRASDEELATTVGEATAQRIRAHIPHEPETSA